MQAATRPNPGKRRVSKSTTLPAPTSGWYVGENLAAAPPQTAYVLDNFFPGQNFVRLRRGSIEYATGMSGAVPRLMVYDNGAASKMFATNGTKIYDVSVTGAASESITGLTSADWQYTQITTSGGTFLRCVNGADTPRVFDGSTWGTTPTITGATPTDLNYVWAYRNRLYFIEKTSMSAWYLPVDSIGGAAVELPLGAVFTLGGQLLVGASWAANLQNVSSELCVFITSQGEVAVYGGSYPGDTATWGIQGIYKIGKPLGRNCIFKAGGDLAIMTEDGIVSMSKVVSLDRIALANEAITAPIQPAWLSAVALRQALDGWSITVWPLESMAIVGVPQLDANDKQQFVANARSGAWCRFTGWDARSFAVFNNALYFGTSSGRVMQAETSGQDDGSLYSGKVVWSYNDFKAGPARKQVKAVRPLYRTTFNALPSFSMLADYSVLSPPAPSAASESSNGALWDTAVWDTAVWPGTSTQKSGWKVVTGFGAVLAPVMQVSVSSTASPELDMLQIDVLYEVGEALG